MDLNLLVTICAALWIITSLITLGLVFAHIYFDEHFIKERKKDLSGKAHTETIIGGIFLSLTGPFGLGVELFFLVKR
jgi:hypothetical protein